MGPEYEDKADPEAVEAALREGIERARKLVRQYAADVIEPEPPAVKPEPPSAEPEPSSEPPTPRNVAS